jgi:hypothetical protein
MIVVSQTIKTLFDETNRGSHVVIFGCNVFAVFQELLVSPVSINIVGAGFEFVRPGGRLILSEVVCESGAAVPWPQSFSNCNNFTCNEVLLTKSKSTSKQF